MKNVRDAVPRASFAADWSERGPLVVESLVRPQTCARIVEAFRTGAACRRATRGVVDATRRDCRFVPLDPTFDPIFEDTIRARIEGFFGIPVRPRLHQRPLVYRYPEGVGFVEHHDLITDEERRRGARTGQPVMDGDFTIVLFANAPEEYGGGDLFFPDHGFDARPAVGSVVVFPVTEAFVHGVRPITSGERFTVVSRVFHAIAGESHAVGSSPACGDGSASRGCP